MLLITTENNLYLSVYKQNILIMKGQITFKAIYLCLDVGWKPSFKLIYSRAIFAKPEWCLSYTVLLYLVPADPSKQRCNIIRH